MWADRAYIVSSWVGQLPESYKVISVVMLYGPDFLNGAIGWSHKVKTSFYGIQFQFCKDCFSKCEIPNS